MQYLNDDKTEVFRIGKNQFIRKKFDANNQKKKALLIYQMATRLLSTARSFIKLGNYYRESGDNKNATITFKKALKVEPDNQLVLKALKNLKN